MHLTRCGGICYFLVSAQESNQRKRHREGAELIAHLRAKSRLRRLRSETRLRAQPLGKEAFAFVDFARQLKHKGINVPAIIAVDEENDVYLLEDLGNTTLFDFISTASENEIVDSQKKNAGIGLSVCATIIKAHGGIITAENTSKGALFRFILDVEDNKNEQ